MIPSVSASVARGRGQKRRWEKVKQKSSRKRNDENILRKRLQEQIGQNEKESNNRDGRKSNEHNHQKVKDKIKKTYHENDLQNKNEHN